MKSLRLLVLVIALLPEWLGAVLVPEGTPLSLGSYETSSNGGTLVTIDTNPVTGEYVACVAVTNTDAIIFECFRRSADDAPLSQFGDFFENASSSDAVFTSFDVILNDAGQSFLIIQVQVNFVEQHLIFGFAQDGSTLFPVITLPSGDAANLALLPGGFALALSTAGNNNEVRVYSDSGQLQTVIPLTAANRDRVSVGTNRSGDILAAWVEDEFILEAQAYRPDGIPQSDVLQVYQAQPVSGFLPSLSIPQIEAINGNVAVIAWADAIFGINATQRATLQFTGSLLDSPAPLYGGAQDTIQIDSAPRIGARGIGDDYTAVSVKTDILPRIRGNLNFTLAGQLALEGDLEPEVLFLEPSSGLLSSTFIVGEAESYDIGMLANGDILLARLFPSPTPRGGEEMFDLTVTRLFQPAVFQATGDTVIEGNPAGGQGPLAAPQVVLVNPHPTGEAVSVSYFTRDNTASEGFDYQFTSGELTFPDASVSSQTVSIPIQPDDVIELDETFTFNLESSNNAVIRNGGAVATITIENDDQTPDIDVDCEPQPGPCKMIEEPLPNQTTNLVFMATMLEPIGIDIAFDYSTVDGTATAGEDYLTTEGSVTIPAGVTQATFTIPILGDDQTEDTEIFSVTLSADPDVSLPQTVFDVAIADDTLCFIEIQPVGHDLPLDGGMRSFSVTTPDECAWTAMANVPWVTLDGQSTAGTGNATLNYTVDARNDQSAPPRFAEIAVSTNLETQLHFVEQEGDAAFCGFVATPDILNFSQTGGDASAAIATPHPDQCAWEAFSDIPWLTIQSPTVPTLGNGALNISVAPNTAEPNVETPTRMTQLDAPFSLQVIQQGCTFDLASPNADVQADGDDSVIIDVLTSGGLNGSCPWTAVANAPWILVLEGSSVTGDGQVTLDVLPNPSVLPRVGTVQVADEIFMVNQDGQPCEYDLEPDMIEVCPDGDLTLLEITATAGCSWTLMPDANWLDITVNQNGVGNEFAELIIDPNLAEQGRISDIQLLSLEEMTLQATTTINQLPFLVFAEFDGTRPTDWIYSPDANWLTTDGQLMGNLLGSGNGQAIDQSINGACSDCKIETTATVSTASSGSFDTLTLVGWYRDQNNFVGLSMDEFANVWRLTEVVGGVPFTAEVPVAQILPNQSYDLTLQFDGSTFSATVDDELLLQLPRQSSSPIGFAGFMVNDNNATFSELRVTGISKDLEFLFIDSFETVADVGFSVCTQ